MNYIEFICYFTHNEKTCQNNKKFKNKTRISYIKIEIFVKQNWFYISVADAAVAAATSTSTDTVVVVVFRSTLLF